MSVAEQALGAGNSGLYDGVAATLDARTLEILERRRRTATVRRRGWLVRRMLLAADVLGLVLAFLIAQLLAGGEIPFWKAAAIFGGTLPGWIVLAKLYGLYDRDEERTEHTTVDDLIGVFHFVTTGVWFAFVLVWAAQIGESRFHRLFVFWTLALALVTVGRSAARSFSHRSLTYLQNTLIVGAGEVGQLVARKILQHPEYGMNLVGFIDAEPKDRRPGLEHVSHLGSPTELPVLVRLFDIERVIIAFSNESHDDTLALIRALGDLNVHVDIVPRLFEIVGPNVGIHPVEGVPLIGLRPARLARSSRLMKRTIDIFGALVGLTLTAPLFAYVALRIRRDSAGPVFFRQTRLGRNMEEFTVFKFRTMYVGTQADAHREYIKSLSDPAASPESNGLFKPEWTDSVTPFGRWLRKTSIDELPQLINVLRGDMSLVGPRPCIAYETETFLPHHFERFHVPAGITGLWQVTARAHTTFREALDMDVSYVRSWSLGLDLRLLFLTPLKAFLQKGTA
ncbi:MAG TPA: sugar transferase [Gaiellaceae bacterium]|nr:sugar transferase [Gaiellaceae bacterium]